MSAKNAADASGVNQESTRGHSREVLVLGPALPTLYEQMQDPTLLRDAIEVRNPGGVELAELGNTVTERRAAEDYYAWLSAIRSIALADNSPAGQDALARAERLAGLPYMSVAARREAVNGVAGYYLNQLVVSPDVELFFYFHPSGGASRLLVANELTAAIRAKDPAAAKRVHSSSELPMPQLLERAAALRPEHVIWALTDDWMGTGETMLGEVRQLLAALKEAGLDAYQHKLEIGLLVAREDQIEAKFNVFTWCEQQYAVGPIPVISYYSSSGAPPFRRDYGPTPTGSHSTVDWGFKDQLDVLKDYARHTGQRLELPLIASIPKRHIGG